jgi:hypothetical protein
VLIRPIAMYVCGAWASTESVKKDFQNVGKLFNDAMKLL